MTKIPENVLTPDILNTRLGSLTFKDGVPSDDTVSKVYDNLDFTRVLDAYMSAYQLGVAEERCTSGS